MCSTFIGERVFLLGVMNIAKKTGVYINCEYCGKEVYKTQTVYNKAKHHFCSTRCQVLQKHKDTYEIRKCEICGKEFEVAKIGTQRFCSIQCQGKWQSTIIGDLNPRSQKIHLSCDWCGKDILVAPYRINENSNHFCSTNCRQTWYTNIFSQSEEWKEESRKRAAILLANKPVQVNSKPQQITNDILEQLDINYRNEEPVVYYAIDNFLTDTGLMIEVMGDYWHSNPLKYTNEKINDRQKHIISRDKAKHTFVKNNYHTEILYVWEKDLTKRPDLCKALIEEYVNKRGILNNYNSFNYSLVNNHLTLNETIIKSHQEL